jgi:glycosyltransferase involved in cell wall biosynthesis
MEIHQFHPSFSYGDAIGNDIIEIQKLLRKWKYKSDIYCQYNSNAHPSKNYKEYLKISSPDNILIIHFSIGYDDEVLDFIKSLPDKKFLIYHNITPSQYFTNINDQYERYTKMGREQLKFINNMVDFAVGVSEYSRQELVKLGFKKTGVLPVLIDFEKYNIKCDISKNNHSNNILFVGRISPNKKQDDIIKVFYYYKKINPNSKLYLVGSYDGLEKYYNMLVDLVKSLKLKDVYFTGKTKFEELVRYYKSADVFICMSEHEGFCVPLIESMIFDVPIIAYKSSAIPYTLGDAGIIANQKNYLEIAEMMNILISDDKFKEKIIKNQKDRLKDFSVENIEKTFRTMLDDLVKKDEVKKDDLVKKDEVKKDDLVKKDEVKKDDLVKKKSIRIEGTFEDSYSLSIVNRNLALALSENPNYNVSLYATTGDGDYVPNLKIINNPKVIELYNNKLNMPDFTIRNIYPPRISGMRAKNRITYFAWEESRIPQEWVNDFNKLDAIFVPSTFVMNILKNSGVKKRMFIIPNAISQELLNIVPVMPLEINNKKNYKFLNISSGFPRKGIDILINAFVEEFSKTDDVCLIIKTFPNIHNKVVELIDSVRKDENCPAIIHIDRDLDERQIAWLYNNSNCLAYPTRGEGFGLPIAEAMLFKIPVIVTNYGGHLDFCNNDNCFLLNYELEPSRTHVKKEWNIENSLWAEPNKEDLKRLMRFVYENGDNDITKNKIEKGYETAKTLTWRKTSEDIIEALSTIEKIKRIKVGMVSTFDTRCGIAEYTKFLVEGINERIGIEILANHENGNDCVRNNNRISVIRCWNKYQEELNQLYDQIKKDKLNIVHFQFNFGFFKLKPLVELLRKLRTDNIKTVLTFHSIEDRDVFGEMVRLVDYKDDLKLVDKIWVHSKNDSKFLADIGIEKNVVCIPHGIKTFPNQDNNGIDRRDFNNNIIISSFGFMLPNKGILEIIKSMSILVKQYPDILLIAVNAIYPENISKEYFETCKKMVKELNLDKNVLFFTEFLIAEDIIDILKLSDMVVMPYKDTKESASGAIRLAISSLKPIIVTNVKIFDDFRNEAFTIEKCSPENIAKGIMSLNDNKRLQETLVFKSKEKIANQNWDNIAKKYEKMVIEICD